MPSEYEPLFTPRAGVDDFEPVRDRFRAASRPFLRSPWSWFAWALLLPGVALATPAVLRAFGPSGVLFAWSAAILLGGTVEIAAIRRSGVKLGGSTPLAAWVLRVQGNVSLIALALSALLAWGDLAWALPGLWLLLLGPSLYVLGGLAFDPFRTCGILFQVGGAAALWPGGYPLAVFALTVAAGSAWVGIGVWRNAD
jgi:hypothetical protein